MKLLSLSSLTLFGTYCACILPHQTEAKYKPIHGEKYHPKYGPALDPKKILATAGSNKILNGENASVGDYPWFAMNVVRINGSLYSAGCGASLIAPGWVLTAAHCVFDELINDGLVLVGALSPFTSGNGGQYSEFIEIDNIYVHPDYDVGGFANNDFALLELVQDSTITPVDFDSTGLSEDYVTGYGDLHAAGFGATATGGSGSTELLEVNLQYVSNSDCMGGSGGTYQWSQGFITDAMMCAADNDLSNSLVESFCQGDSGGPLYDATNNVVVGLSSFGRGTRPDDGAVCMNLPQYPPVFARISDGYNWMQSIMGTTPTITAAPSEENLDTTSASPSEEPPSADCKDSSLTFKVLWNGRNRKKTCSFANSATKCDVAGVSEICSKTCNSCDTCADTSLRFKVALSSTKSRFKDCAWVEAKKTEERCALEGVKEACCATCAAFA